MRSAVKMSAKTKYDLNVMCRVCLKESSGMTNIFQPDCSSILEAVTLCAGVRISSSDGLPNQICEECYILANNALFFRQKCVNSDSKLKDHLFNESAPYRSMEMNLMNLNDVGDYFQLESLFSSPKGGQPWETGSVAPCYVCHLCQSVGKSCKELVEHVISCHAPPPASLPGLLTCALCERQYPNKFDLLKHQSIHKELFAVGETVSCPFCNELFGSSEPQQEHMATHVQSSSNRCDKCGCCFATDLQLNQHHKTSHVQVSRELAMDSVSLKTDLSLLDDSYSFLEKELELGTDDLIMETNNLSGGIINQPVSKSKCISDYDTDRVLSQVLGECQGGEDCAGQASDLNVDSGKLYSLLESVEVEFTEPCVEPASDYSPTKPSGRSTPKRRLPRKFSCPTCARHFTRLSALKRHQGTHRGAKENLCPQCGLTYAKRWHLKRHLATHQDSQQVFSCTICCKTFAKSGTYQYHMKKHRGKALVCTLCGKALSTSSNLSLHMRRHAGETTVTCPICDKQFYNGTDLRRHARLHTGEKPFKCDLCPATFAKSDTLTTHQRVHTGERPFSCDLCGKKFKHKRDAMVHRNKACRKAPPTTGGAGEGAREETLQHFKVNKKL